jgi:hypothetical protein
LPSKIGCLRKYIGVHNQISGSRLLIAIQFRVLFRKCHDPIRGVIRECSRPLTAVDLSYPRCQANARAVAGAALVWPPLLLLRRGGPSRPPASESGNLNRPGQDKRPHSFPAWPRRSAAAICPSRPVSPSTLRWTSPSLHQVSNQQLQLSPRRGSESRGPSAGMPSSVRFLLAK